MITVKGTVLIFVQMWLRWTLPRLRIDQVMTTCLKYLVPISCFLFLGAAVWPLALAYLAGGADDLAAEASTWRQRAAARRGRHRRGDCGARRQARECRMEAPASLRWRLGGDRDSPRRLNPRDRERRGQSVTLW